jgi:hypothetical protein
VRSNRDPQQLTAAITRTVRSVDAGLPITIFTWNQELNDAARFASRTATMTLGVMGLMGALLSIVGIFGQRWGELSNCWRLVRPLDCSSGCWRRECWLTSCIRQLLVIRWC